MDYEKLYKESLERAKIWQDHLNESGDKDYADELNYIFPELQESEGDRTRKELIGFLEELSKLGKNTNFDRWKTSDCANWIAWLEKQETVDENEVANCVLNEVANSIMRWLDSNCAEGNMCLSGMECEDIENAVRNANWQKIYGYMKKKLEKQGEQKVSYTTTVETGDGGINALVTRDIEIPFGAKDSELQEVSYYIPKGYYAKIEGDKVVIKKGEEKPVNYTDEDIVEAVKDASILDKAEPKFHRGEWVIHQGTENIYQVIAVIGNQYQLKYGDNYTVQNCADVDRCARLWDITKDAKAGDVLTCESGWTCIFKSLNNGDTFSSYCFMDRTKSFFETGSECHTLNEEFTKAYNGEIKPATKEQRELLFQKMKEAGYMWDEKKNILVTKKNKNFLAN